MEYNKNEIKDYLIDHLNFFIVGSLLKGIIHNFNGPLQVLSMHVELSMMDLQREKKLLDALVQCDIPEDVRKMVDFNINRLEKRRSAIATMQSAVVKIEKLVQLLTTRAWDPQALTTPVALAKLIEDETVFWQGDLFFKHKVTVSVVQNDPSCIIQTIEGKARDVFDSMMAICIELLRNSTNRSLTIEIKRDEGHHLVSFRHSGLDIDIGRRHELEISPELVSADTQIFMDCLASFAEARTHELGWEFGTRQQEITCKIPATPRKSDAGSA